MFRVYASVVIVTMTLFFADVAPPLGCCSGEGGTPPPSKGQTQLPR